MKAWMRWRMRRPNINNYYDAYGFNRDRFYLDLYLWKNRRPPRKVDSLLVVTISLAIGTIGYLFYHLIVATRSLPGS